MKLALACSITLLSVMASAAQGEQPTPLAEAPIVVEGHRLEATVDVRRVIRDVGVQQLARFEEPICPQVNGAIPSWSAEVEQMIRGSIAAVGAALGKPGCKANAIVIFARNPTTFVQNWSKRQPEYFNMHPRAFANFVAAARPVVSWHVTSTRDRDGKGLGARSGIGETKELFGQKVTVAAPVDTQTNPNAAASRLYANSREDMTMGFVVIDGGAVDGKTTRQLADLATMHLLLDVRQDAEANHPASILSLLEPRSAGVAPPPGLSRFDRGMLQGLYTRRANNLSAAQQYGNIVKAVRQAAEVTQE